LCRRLQRGWRAAGNDCRQQQAKQVAEKRVEKRIFHDVFLRTEGDGVAGMEACRRYMPFVTAE
jgi:hypothetical protein